MTQRQRGFTMIELVIVIVILGILAAVAMPKFIDLSGDARQNAVNSVAAAAGSASVVNYAGCSSVNHTVTANRCATVNNCTDVPALLVGSALPSGYTTADNGADNTTNGGEKTCTVTFGTNTATFIAVMAGN